MKDATLQISGLSRADLLELEDHLGQKLTPEPKPGGAGAQFNEPGTVIVVLTLGAAAISTIGVWLAARRKRSKREVLLEERGADGSYRRLEIRTDDLDHDPKAAVLKQLPQHPWVAEALKSIQGS